MLILRVGQGLFGDGDGELVLRKHGIRSEQVESGREALEFLRLYDYDLALMDLHLPDAPAYQAIRMIRAASFRVPVVILSDTATIEAKVKVLDQGADDFLVTPCDTEELLARMRAVVRRSQGHTKSTLTLGPVELSLDCRDVRVYGQSLHLSRREYAVLELLFLKQGVILNKGAFLTHLYCGMEEPEMKTIDVIVCRLRKKLVAAGVPSLIDTIWGCGYKLCDPSADPTVDGHADAPSVAPAWSAQEAVAA